MRGAATAAVIVVLLGLPAGAGAAGPVPAVDFDGDGREDLAVSAPGVDLGDVAYAGVVTVLYGSGAGPGAERVQELVQPGRRRDIPADAEALGLALAAGDFDGDGFTDLAAGAPGTDVGGVDAAGVVVVFPGSAAGLDQAAAQVWHEDRAGVVDAAEPLDRFGSALAAGDLDGDGHDDLAVGVALEDVGGLADAGAVHVLYGSAGGISADGDTRVTQSSAGVPSAAATGERFGTAVAVGDVGGGPEAELVAGAPGEAVGAAGKAGAVFVVPGSPAGATGAGSTRWTQATPGVPGDPGQGDELGAVLLVADLAGTGEGDVVIGVPQDGAAGVARAGLVVVLPGSADGPTAGGAYALGQHTAGVPDAPEAGDNFGSTLAAGDLDGDGDLDLAVTSFDESVGDVQRTGSVTVLPGGPGGPTGAGGRRLTEESRGVAGEAGANDHFGAGLGAGHHVGGPEADLVVGVPNDDVGAALESGSVHVLAGSATGVTTSGEVRVVRPAPDDEDKLGFAVA